MSDLSSCGVELDDIRAARELVRGVVIETPVETSRWLSDLVGAPVLLKCENLQRTGSFKSRGAYVRIARLTDEERAKGVVAASAGNHAQGVALAARLTGASATVFMPEGAPIPKERATRGYGADVLFAGRTVDESLAAAHEYAARTGAVLIHPFDHPDIIAGQGTVGLEILEQVPDVRTVVVPAGGGGLIAGVAVAIKAQRPDVRVVGVQAEGAASYPTSLAAGGPVPLAAMKTMADGIAVGRPGDLTFAAVRDHVDEIRTVTEESISRALLSLLERAKLVVEPAGAVGIAALLDEPGAFEGPVAVVLSGGNIDPLLLSKVIRHGLAADGRYLVLRVVLDDAPGALAGLLALIAEAGANVVHVSHGRTDPALSVDQVEVLLQLETRGLVHAAQLRDRLAASGYRVDPSS
ncbi:threonine ammonia-lyase [Nocardioides sp. BP30]|uniref:threonine ammonia-lyase n=1 Tax=Nocardioides sp. BP30 TaxID=3036374 RepID=UPI0024690488|nr:threonine ammonia-lyase [Nocardioides sp. BP30]WGL53374.1 threonine ammonia-lyase [Nocardioides sp. BP30]